MIFQIIVDISAVGCFLCVEWGFIKTKA